MGHAADAEGGDAPDMPTAERDADGSPGDSPGPSEQDSQDARTPTAAAPAPAPRPPEDAAYRVHWLDRNGRGTGTSAVLRGGELTRRRPPLTKELVKRWLLEVAECDAVKVRAGPVGSFLSVEQTAAADN